MIVHCIGKAPTAQMARELGCDRWHGGRGVGHALEAEELGIEVRLQARATPELNAMDHLWKHTKREAPGGRRTETDYGRLATLCRYVERTPLRAGLVARAEHWP